jgi:hypothetical protein
VEVKSKATCPTARLQRGSAHQVTRSDGGRQRNAHPKVLPNRSRGGRRTLFEKMCPEAAWGSGMPGRGSACQKYMLDTPSQQRWVKRDGRHPPTSRWVRRHLRAQDRRILDFSKILNNICYHWPELDAPPSVVPQQSAFGRTSWARFTCTDETRRSRGKEGSCTIC